MFDKFGEMDSAAEINMAADGLLKENDTENIIILAKENGIDEEDARDFINGDVQELCTDLMAAVEKINLERKDLELNGILNDWADEIIMMCNDNEEIRRAVRKKGKALVKCMALLLRFAFENKVKVCDKVVNITNVLHNGKEEPMRKPLYLGIPNRAEVKKIAKEYYLS